ncbi:MAG: hypothetical protein Q7J73_06275 [Dehalococcoidales bacterium]|nr:hypothetical protein [Dehalococcoidales bacterium]
MAQNKAEYQARKAAFESGQITPDILRGLNMGRILSTTRQGEGVIIIWVIRDHPRLDYTTYLTFVNDELKSKTITHNTYRRR